MNIPAEYSLMRVNIIYNQDFLVRNGMGGEVAADTVSLHANIRSQNFFFLFLILYFILIYIAIAATSPSPFFLSRRGRGDHQLCWWSIRCGAFAPTPHHRLKSVDSLGIDNSFGSRIIICSGRKPLSPLMNPLPLLFVFLCA